MRCFRDISLINNDVVNNNVVNNEIFDNMLFLIKIDNDNDEMFDFFLIDGDEIVFNILIFSNVDE